MVQFHFPRPQLGFGRSPSRVSGVETDMTCPNKDLEGRFCELKNKAFVSSKYKNI